MKKKNLIIYGSCLSLILFSLVFLSFSNSISHQNKNLYVGSEACLKCHESHYHGWKNSLHAKMEQDIIREGPDKNVLGDFTSKDSVVTHTLAEIDMIIGSRFKQRYTKKIGDDYYMLPFQWNVESEKWVKYNPKNDWWAKENIYPKAWKNRPHSTLCAGCHATGFNIETKDQVELNIGCEACHGPGNLHLENPINETIINPVKLSQERGNMVCFQCHMSGRPSMGQFEKYAWPVGYKPGEDLKKYWNYAITTGENSYELWAEGFAHKNRVQGNTFIQSKMYKKGDRKSVV